MTDLYSDLEARTIIKQVTDPALKQALAQGPLTLYAGFDPTADSLHVGSLFPLLTLRRFQQAGHRAIAVVGGATGMIGDPSGKSAERSLLTDGLLQHNVAGITEVVRKFLKLDGSNPALVTNNGDWFKGVSYIDFLRDVGKHFTINHMMAKESVRARLEDRDHGISYTEFSYMLLQAYDFFVLNEREGCRLQIGGSDQWGNITAGIELIRRMKAAKHEGVALASDPASDCFGLTHPLISKADGTKFGKTESGTIWLDAKKTSPYQLYQFFIRSADADVITFLKYLSFKPLEEILALEQLLKSEPEKRAAQTALARELTELIHGRHELERVEKATQALFGASIRELDERTLLDVLAEAPSSAQSKASLGTLALVDALVTAGLAQGKGAARKDLVAGGVYVNNERVSDEKAVLRTEDLIAGAYIVLRKGKRTYHLLKFS